MIEPGLLELIRDTRGFMPEEEGRFLHESAVRALAADPVAPVVEIGSYCGKSALWLGAAARRARPEESQALVVTVDHHRGSEENQPGWEYHDPSVVDPEAGRMDTLPFLRRALLRGGLEDRVVCVVGGSAAVARWWRTPLSLLFIDGGHGAEPAHTDYASWAPWVRRDGLLAIHDVFEDPADGGRPPYEIYRRAIESGDFAHDGRCGSLHLLRRTSGAAGDPVR